MTSRPPCSLFLLRSYADIDHIAPLVWTMLERGERALLLFEERYDAASDFRLSFLLRSPNCSVIALPGLLARSRVVRLAAHVRWSRGAIRRLLRREGVSTLFVEWGDGVLPFRQIVARLRQRRRAKTRAGARQAGSFLRELVLYSIGSTRSKLIASALRLGLPVFALPHGVSTKLAVDYHPKLTELMKQNAGELPFDDRNCFTAWVFPAEFHRQLMIAQARMDPAVGQTWGSLRFCPEWMAVLDRILPPSGLPARAPGQLRVVFFLPKWGNRVDRPRTNNLLRMLAARTDLQLIVKTHPRPGVSELDPDTLADLAANPSVVMAGQAHSAALVRESDVTIDIGSGMAIDAALLRRYLIYPAFLHGNRLIFDEVQACVIPADEAETMAALDRMAAGTEPPLSDEVVAALARECVYGGREPFDVPAHYHERVQARR